VFQNTLGISLLVKALQLGIGLAASDKRRHLLEVLELPLTLS
jgi:hypothetical protein